MFTIFKAKITQNIYKNASNSENFTEIASKRKGNKNYS